MRGVAATVLDVLKTGHMFPHCIANGYDDGWHCRLGRAMHVLTIGSLCSNRLAPQPLELGLCKAVYYFFLEEYDMPSAGMLTLQACATMPKPASTVPS